MSIDPNLEDSEFNFPPPGNNKVHGDFVSGDKIVYESITGYSGVAIGRGVQDSVSQMTPSSEAVAGLFRVLYSNAQMQNVPATPETLALLERIEYEVMRGATASTTGLEALLNQLNRLSPGLTQQLTTGLERLSPPPAVSKALNIGGVIESEAAAAAAPFASSMPAPEHSHAAQIEQTIQACGLDAAVKTRLLSAMAAIQDEVRREVTPNAGWADLVRVQSALDELLAYANEIPGLLDMLRAWLVYADHSPATVRILAKKMLS